MSVYIEIRDSANSLEGRLDVSDSENFPLILNKKLSDYKKLNKRSGIYSVDFEIPLSKTNTNLYDSIYDANLKDTQDYFLKKDAIIYSDNLQVVRGQLKVNSVVDKKGVKYLNVVFFGNNLEWVTEFSTMSLQDVTYQDTSFEYSAAAVKSAWANTAADSDYTFAAIHRGRGGSKYRPYVVSDFRPDLFIKRLLENAFSTIGYTLESTFFDSTSSGFDSLILPHFSGKDWVHSNSTITSNTAVVGLAADLGFNVDPTNYRISKATGLDFTCEGTDHNIPLNVDSGTGFTDTNNIYNTSTYQFDNFSLYGDYTFHYNIDLYYQRSGAASDRIEVWFRSEYTDGSIVRYYEERIRSVTGVLPSSYSVTVNGVEYSRLQMSGDIASYIYDNASSNAKFFVRIFRDDKAVKLLNCDNKSTIPCIVKSTSRVEAVPSKEIRYSSSINIADVMPNDFYILDLINDLTKMFNLYWSTNTAIKKVSVEPRKDFFTDITTADDYTSKLDLSNGYTLTDIRSSYNRYFNFQYLEDSNDAFVKEVNKMQKERGGTTIADLLSYDFGTGFKDGEQSLKHDKIASSYNIEGGAYQLWTTRMWKDYTSSPPERTFDFAPRILSYQYTTQQQYNGAGNRNMEYWNESTSTLETITTIPYALDRSIIRNGVLEASVPINLTYHDTALTTSSNTGLVTEYYADSLGLIAGLKNLKINLILPMSDFDTIDFKTPIYFSAPEEIQGYWTFESISDMKVSNNIKSVKCSLNRFINTEPLSEYVKPFVVYINPTISNTPPTTIFGIADGENEGDLESLSEKYNLLNQSSADSETPTSS